MLHGWRYKLIGSFALCFVCFAFWTCLPVGCVVVIFSSHLCCDHSSMAKTTWTLNDAINPAMEEHGRDESVDSRIVDKWYKTLRSINPDLPKWPPDWCEKLWPVCLCAHLAWVPLWAYVRAFCRLIVPGGQASPCGMFWTFIDSLWFSFDTGFCGLCFHLALATRWRILGLICFGVWTRFRKWYAFIMPNKSPWSR